MAKPKKGRGSAAKTKGKAAPRTPALILADARAQLAAGRFRDAIVAYKALLKSGDTPEPRPQIERELARAYAGRARDLAAKGMPKEALAVWENRTQLAPDLPPEPEDFALLLALGQVDAVAPFLAGDRPGMDASVLAGLHARLAALHLAGEPAVAASLPADNPVLVQGAAASRALDAWCAGDDASAREAVAAIPFRSPYRDFAQILKALLRLSEAPGEAAGLLARVPGDSPFAPLAGACGLALGAPGAPFAGLAERLTDHGKPAGEAAARFAMALAGWGPAARALAEDAGRLADSGPKGLLRLMYRHRGELGEAWARRRALRLLLPGWPKSAGDLAAAGWRRPSEEERLLVSAWRAEVSKDLWDELDAWQEYADAVRRGDACAPGSEPALKAALALRRADRNGDVLGRAVARNADPEEMEDLPDEVAQAVETSLALDPDDRESAVRVARWYLHADDAKAARRILEPALERFPDDVGLLGVALDLAIANGSFKKAARYAREILRVDPIDTAARARLVAAHLAHARKQVRAGRPDLARAELAQAAEWDPQGRFAESRAVLDALLTLGADPSAGRSALRGLADGMGGGLAAAFVLALEAAACGRPPADVLKAAGLGRIPKPDAAALADFLTRLRARLELGETVPDAVAKRLASALKSAARVPLPPSEAEAACETLRRAELSEAREAIAEAALRAAPGAPVFVFHAVDARLERGSGLPSLQDMGRLSTAHLEALKSGDTRTAHRLADLMGPGFLGFGGRPPLSGPFGWDEDDEEADEHDEPDWAGGPGLGMPRPDHPTMVADLIEMLGLDRLLEILGIEPEIRRALRDLERSRGRKAVADRLVEILADSTPDDPPGPVPGGGKGRGPSRRKSRSDDDPDHGPEQLDLFP